MSPIFKGTSKGNAAQTLLPFGCFLSFYLISHSLGCSFQFNSAHSVVSDSVTPWTAHPASLSITNSWSLLKLMSIRLVMPSNHLILCQEFYSTAYELYDLGKSFQLSLHTTMQEFYIFLSSGKKKKKKPLKEEDNILGLNFKMILRASSSSTNLFLNKTCPVNLFHFLAPVLSGSPYFCMMGSGLCAQHLCEACPSAVLPRK